MVHYRSKFSVGCFLVAFMCLEVSSLGAVYNQTYSETTFIDEIFAQYGEKNETRVSQERFRDLLKQLTLGNVYIERLDKSCLYKGVHSGYKEEPTRTDEVTKQKSEGKLLRRRRSGDHGDKNGKQTENPKHKKHLRTHITQCISRKRLLQKHNLSDGDPLSKADFVKICPALIQQINAGFCIHRHNCSEKPYYLRIVVNANMVWAYGFVAITVVSLASLCIIAVIPCLEKSFYQRIMGYLVALAVGTLAGDALLHLIPHVQFGSVFPVIGLAWKVENLYGLKFHTTIKYKQFEEAFQSLLSTSEAEHKRNIWKSCFILVGMYAFFLVEQLMKAKEYINCCGKKGQRKHSHHKSTDNKSVPEEELRFKDLNDKGSNDKLHGENCSCHGSAEALNDAQKSPSGLSNSELLPFPPSEVKKIHDNHDPHAHLDYHDHHDQTHDLKHDHGHSHGKLDKNTSVATVAWMVIVGDGFHNFSDGLAIGAAFAASYSSGISTAIAVFCHELPHELGDFAVLIKSGMSIRQAICYNLVSAVLSYIGLVIGIAVGNYSEDGKQFALALTAGLFLYVALANMLPELTSAVAEDVGDLWTFISPHLGILSGIAIMLLISVYEDKF